MIFRDFKREKDELKPSVFGAAICSIGSLLLFLGLIYHSIDLTTHFLKMKPTPRIMFCGLVLFEFVGLIFSAYGVRWHLRGLRDR